MKFQVPQFIEIEDKIFGPLTFKQFVYLAGGAGLSFILWILLPTIVALPLILIGISFSLALAFYTYNGKPFVFLIQSWISYILSNKLYLWKKEQKEVRSSAQKATTTPVGESVVVPKLSQGRLKDVAWSLDVEEPTST